MDGDAGGTRRRVARVDVAFAMKLLLCLAQTASTRSMTSSQEGSGGKRERGCGGAGIGYDTIVRRGDGVKGVVKGAVAAWTGRVGMMVHVTHTAIVGGLDGAVPHENASYRLHDSLHAHTRMCVCVCVRPCVNFRFIHYTHISISVWVSRYIAVYKYVRVHVWVIFINTEILVSILFYDC